MAAARFRQLAEELSRRLDSGEFEEGAQLPTEVELMTEYDASRNTIRDAVKLLIGRGLVATSPGRGTFVLKAVDPFALTLVSTQEVDEVEIYRFEARLQGREAEIDDPRVEIQKATPEVAEALQIKPGDRTVNRHQERRIDGRPWSLQTSHYPLTFVTQRGADRLIDTEDIPEGVVSYLQRELGIEQVGYRDKITARVPDAHEAGFFNLPDSGSTVIVHDRISFDRNQRPIRLTNTVYPADRNELYVEVGEVPVRPAIPTKLNSQDH